MSTTFPPSRPLGRTLQGLGLLAALAVAAFAPASVQAQAANGYELVQPPQNTSSAEQVEVLEFFWLGCPHCYAFEPTIEAWAENRGDNVAFVREAPPLNSSWEQHSRGFYAAQLLGQEGPFVEAMFKSIHEEKKRMVDPKDIAALAAGLGMDEEKFLATMNSFAVETRMKRSMQLARGAGITGVPAIMINGKYRTGAQLAGGNAGIIDVIEQTVALEKTSMGLE